MSSHPIHNMQHQQQQQQFDPNYILLQNLRISETAGEGRVSNTSPQRNVRYVNKPIIPQHQTSAQGYINVHLNNSPTHSLSGSSQHSESPRTSLIGGNNLIYELKNGPVYENLDYYVTSNDSAGYYDTSNKKSQPQNLTGLNQIPNSTSNGNIRRYAHTPQPEYEPPPIYENLQTVSSQRAQQQATPASSTIYYERNAAGQLETNNTLPPPYSSAMNSMMKSHPQYMTQPMNYAKPMQQSVIQGSSSKIKSPQHMSQNQIRSMNQIINSGNAGRIPANVTIMVKNRLYIICQFII